MLSNFIVGATLLKTGLADLIGEQIYRLVGSREVPLMVTIMLVAGTLSAFINNVAATAVLISVVASIAHCAELSRARLFMPLSFGAILGKTTTLVGTPSHILAAAVLREGGFEPFTFFDLPLRGHPPGS